VNKLINIICFLLSFSLLLSQERLQINKIKVEGNKRFSSEDIIRISKIYPGMEIVSDEIHQGIDKLWNLNRFNDINIIIDSKSDLGLNIIIQLEEADLLNDLKVSGNKKINLNKIKEASELETGQILTDKNKFNAKQRIINAYKEKGFHGVQITDTTLQSNIDFASDWKLIISEGKKSKIENIIINGNQSFSDFRLKRILKNNKEWKWYTPWTGKLKENEIDSDMMLLKTFYQNRGFKDFYFSNDSLKNEGGSLTLIYDIYEGPKYYHRNVDWVGNELVNDSTLSNAFNIQNGDVFSLEKFNFSLFQNVSSLYMDKGYLNVSLAHNFHHVKNDSIDVLFDITENNIVKVRKIIIKGNEKTNESVIRREVDIYPGDVFNRTKFINVRTKIMLLNFFENVIPDIVPISEDEVDLVIEVIEKGVGQANFSMGWNKVQGFNGGGGFQLPNFLGRGQTISLSYNRGLSGSSTYSNTNTSSSNNVSQSFSISFFEPALYDTPNMIGLSYSYYETPSSRTISGLDIKSSSVSLRLGRRKLDWPDDNFKVSWVFTKSVKKYSANEEQNLLNAFPYISSNNIESLNNIFEFQSSGVSLSQIITRRSLNHPEFPTQGSDFTWDFTYSGGFLGGFEDYLKNIFSFNFFIPITEKITIGNLFKFGNIERTSDNSIIPPQKYFVMGGSGIPYGEMLRGYPENSVGPYYYENNYPVGGKLLSRYSIEGRFLLSPNPTMYGFVFLDAGNVWSGYNTIDPYHLKRSAGFGIRLYMPMLGLIGYDIGYGFDPSSFGDSDSPWGWDHHLIFGAGMN